MFVAIDLDRDPADIEAIEQAILRGIDATTEMIQNDFYSLTVNWFTVPYFEQVPAAPNGAEFVGFAGTDDPVFGYVSRGTAPHSIYAVWAEKLSFPASTPKTQPGLLKSGGGSQGSTFVFTKSVNHPGIKARGFEELEAKHRQSDLEENVMRYIELAVGS